MLPWKGEVCLVSVCLIRYGYMFIKGHLYATLQVVTMTTGASSNTYVGWITQLCTCEMSISYQIEFIP